MTETLPTHSECPSCGEQRRMSAYVYAHWDIELVTTCDKCGTKYGVCEGESYELDSELPD